MPTFDDDALSDGLAMSTPSRRRTISLDFFIWKNKAKSLTDPEELSLMMDKYYMAQAETIKDPQLKALTILAIGTIDWYGIAEELISSTNFKTETRN
ncbi:MAG: hypothetical protein ACO3CL_08130 [Bacteroidia bacterium]|jgi:hypothetical protein